MCFQEDKKIIEMKPCEAEEQYVSSYGFIVATVCAVHLLFALSQCYEDEYSSDFT